MGHGDRGEVLPEPKAEQAPTRTVHPQGAGEPPEGREGRQPFRLGQAEGHFVEGIVGRRVYGELATQFFGDRVSPRPTQRGSNAEALGHLQVPRKRRGAVVLAEEAFQLQGDIPGAVVRYT